MPVMQSPPDAHTVIDGQSYLYFAGTGYLGLQGHPEVIRAACQATRQYGVGSATSRGGFGDVPPTLEVERRAAEFFASEEAFYFASGYVGNRILTQLFEDAFDALFVDELSHYSVFEAARLIGRPTFRFRHRDREHLEASLVANLKPRQRPLVLSDGVFSALGTIAPVVEYRDLLAGYAGAALCIDDAHAVGVLGTAGRGTFEHAGLIEAGVNTWPDAEDRPADTPGLLFCGTLSKAVGGFGGIIPGTRPFIRQLKTTSHYYDGASAVPVPAAAATARALELLQTDPRLRSRLASNVRLLKSGLGELGLETEDTPVPIVCLKLGPAAQMRTIQRELMQRGIVIAYLAAYSGLGSEGALRLAVFSTHTDEMIGRLLGELGRLL